MKFKTDDLKAQFWTLHPKLQCIVMAVSWHCKDLYKIETTATSFLRVDNETSVHFFKIRRGADLRSFDFSDSQITEIVDWVNKTFPYGDNIHNTCLYHDTGAGFHFHLQVKEDGKENEGGDLGEFGQGINSVQVY